MELKLNEKEVEKIILLWAEKEMPGKFNTVVMSGYGSHNAELLFVKPKLEVEQVVELKARSNYIQNSSGEMFIPPKNSTNRGED